MRSAVVDLASQPTTNLAMNPKCDVDMTGWSPAGNSGTKSLSRSASGGPFGGPYCRMTWTATSPTLSINTDLFQFGTVPWGGQTIGAAIPAKPLATYAVSYYVRPSKTVVLGAQLQGILGSGGAGQSAEGSATCPANVWTRLSTTWTTVSNTAAIRVDLDHVDPTVNVWNVGDTLDIANIMLTESTSDPGYYADGSIPGWKWTGTAGASTSVGYPYTLESIAGAPLFTVPLSGSSVLVPDLGPLQGRTMYIVHDISAADVADTTSFTTIGTWRDAATPTNGQLYLQQVGPSNGVQVRVDTMAGTNFHVQIGNVRTVGRHVSVASVNDGMTSGTLDFDGATQSVVVTPGTGMPINTGAAKLFPNSNAEAVYAVGYGVAHGAETRKRVAAWLARQYGAPVPAGY